MVTIKTKVISILIAVLLLVGMAVVSLTIVNAADEQADPAVTTASSLEN